MFGREDLARLRQAKQVLTLESSLNRLNLRAELQALSQSAASLTDAGRLLRKPSALLLVLAPIAGLLLARNLRGSDSWFSRLASAAKWLLPLYQAWRTFSPPPPAP
jgi:hypothetical protein